MRASPRSGRRRSPSEPPRRGGFVKPRVGPVGAGVLAVLAGFPVLAQVGAFPPAEPAQEESLPPAETEPAPAAGLPPPALPRNRPLRSASAPDVFPGIFGGRPPSPGGSAPAEPASPFGLSPDIFPGIFGGRPDRRTSEQPDIPSETGEPDVPTAPTGDQPEAAPEPERGADRTRAGSCRHTGARAAGFFDASLRVRLSPRRRPCCRRTPRLPRVVGTAPRRQGSAPLRPGALPVQAYDRRAPADPDSAERIGIRGVYRQSAQHAG